MQSQNTHSDCLKRTDRMIKVVTKIMSRISGALFLGLAFYMTGDVISRKLGGPFTGVTDEISSYILAFSGTWALAYALADERHVRIDVLFHLYSARFKHIINIGALFLTGVFACVLAEEMWGITLESFKINAKGAQAMLDIPLAIPQGLAAIGFSVLAIQAFLLILMQLRGFKERK